MFLAFVYLPCVEIAQFPIVTSSPFLELSVYRNVVEHLRDVLKSARTRCGVVIKGSLKGV
jgi:hypothetical protein